MRIGHCVHGFGLGGAQKVIASIVRGRSAALQHLVYSSGDGVLRREIEDAGATVRVIRRFVPKLDPWWALRLASAMRRDAVDVVHTHLFGDSLHGYLAARLAGALPVVMTIHNQASGRSRLQQLGYRWLAQRTARAVTCSKAASRSFADILDATLAAIPNGIEDPAVNALDGDEREALRRGLGAAPDTVLLACVGRLTPQKGQGVLLEALSRLAPTAGGVRLLLIGDGEQRRELEERSRSLGVSDRVSFTGFRDDVAEMLRAVDVVVFSSLWEGLPIALLEAMGAGRCIVTSDVPGILEAVREDREALVVPAGDAGTLAAALDRAVADRELRSRLGAAARRRFEERYAAAKMVRSYEVLYREVLAATEEPLP